MISRFFSSQRFGINCVARLLVLCLFTTLSLPPTGLYAQQGHMTDTEWEDFEKRIDKAVKWLLKRQNSDGSIADAKQRKVTMTALAVMSLGAVGHQLSDQTPEGQAMRKGMEYILRPENQSLTGYFGHKYHNGMYDHGIITLLLAESLGMGADEKQDKKIRDRLEKAIKLILRSQAVRKRQSKDQGGWRYKPNSQDADLSVTAWQLIALKAARNAGVEVPKEAIEDASKYVKRCFHAKGKPEGPDNIAPGYFTYMAGQGNMRFGSAAAGLLCLQIIGEWDSPEVKGSAQFFLDYKIPKPKGRDHFYYGMYYYAQGMYQFGGENADHARKTVREIMFGLQQDDGSWPLAHKARNVGSVYSTCMALLSLSIHYHYLPIYQR
jgi:hypothetical protein